MMGCDAPYGTIYAINPGMIIVLVPLVSLLTANVPHFDMVHYGSYISASSPFWIYLISSPLVLGPILFVVQLSLGEAVWSPRWCASPPAAFLQPDSLADVVSQY
jgi:proton-dependent oligopeptide transporter, POT family